MRSAEHLSFLRTSFVDFLKRSSDTLDSQSDEEPAKTSFYTEFALKQRMRWSRIVRVNKVTDPNTRHTYAVYCIEVVTDDLHYEISKRYSEFESFYRRSVKKGALVSQFPAKTIFTAGWREDVTHMRMDKLNRLLEQINHHATTPGLKHDLYDFLSLYETYQQKGLFATQQNSQAPTSDDFLLISLCKLNHQNKHGLQIFEKIKTSMAQRKRRVPSEMARQMLLGYEGQSGLMALVLRSGNELIALEGLKLLNWLMSAETNRDYETFMRVLGKCNGGALVLEYPENMWEMTELRIEYFHLLSHYEGVKGQTGVKDVSRLMKSGYELQEQYQSWLRFQQMQIGF